MREEQQALEQPKNNGNGNGYHVVMLILRSISATVEVFLHKGFGSRYIGFQGFLGIFAILIFAAMIPVPGTWGLILFLFAYLKACLYARAGIVWRKLRGQEHEHTLYSGYPYLMRLFRRSNEMTIKRYIEPIVVFLAGCAFSYFVPALALYLFMAAGALFLSVNEAEAYQRRQTQVMHDAVIEAQQRAERFRSMSGRR
jgi:hypothetical protein